PNYDLVLMVAGEQQNGVATSAGYDIEVIKDIPTEDANVRGRGIGESGKVTPDSRHFTIGAREFQYGRYHNMRAGAADACQSDSRWGVVAQKLELSQQGSTQRRAIRRGIDEKGLVR